MYSLRRVTQSRRLQVHVQKPRARACQTRRSPPECWGRHKTHLPHQINKLGEFPHPIIGHFIAKCAEWAANGPVWMPQALESICVIQFWSWVNPPFPLLALWGNKKWLPSMKVKKMEKFQNKIGWMDSKWSSLNVPGTENPLSASRVTQLLTKL